MANGEKKQKDSDLVEQVVSNDLLHKHLTMLTPAFGVLHKEAGLKFIDEANECLKDTPFMFFLTGDGVAVLLKEQMLGMAKGMFDRPMGDYSE